MRTNPFQHFLTEVYAGEKSGKPLSLRLANDARSRGARIEKVLGIDLDLVLDGQLHNLDRLIREVESNSARFEIDGVIRTGISSIKNAARLYHRFRAWETAYRGNRKNQAEWGK